MKTLRSKVEDVANKFVGMRLPSDILDKLDGYVEQFNREHPGLNINRTDAIRTLLTKALEGVESKPHPKKPGGK